MQLKHHRYKKQHIGTLEELRVIQSTYLHRIEMKELLLSL